MHASQIFSMYSIKNQNEIPKKLDFGEIIRIKSLKNQDHRKKFWYEEIVII